MGKTDLDDRNTRSLLLNGAIHYGNSMEYDIDRVSQTDSEDNDLYIWLKSRYE